MKYNQKLQKKKLGKRKSTKENDIYSKPWLSSCKLFYLHIDLFPPFLFLSLLLFMRIALESSLLRKITFWSACIRFSLCFCWLAAFSLSLPSSLLNCTWWDHCALCTEGRNASCYSSSYVDTDTPHSASSIPIPHSTPTESKERECSVVARGTRTLSLPSQRSALASR